MSQTKHPQVTTKVNDYHQISDQDISPSCTPFHPDMPLGSDPPQQWTWTVNSQRYPCHSSSGIPISLMLESDSSHSIPSQFKNLHSLSHESFLDFYFPDCLFSLLYDLLYFRYFLMQSSSHILSSASEFFFGSFLGFQSLW